MQLMPNELVLSRLIRSLNLRRLKNLVLTASSFFLSALTGKTFIRGRPAILTIEPTNLCNLHCPLCTTGAGDMKRVQGRMSLETFQRILDLFGDDIFFLLLYHQGEPYLNKYFLDFVKLAKQKNIYCTTSTNGHYFDEETIHATIDSGLDSMIVSLDGVTQETYEHYRVNGKLEKVLDGLQKFMEIKRQRKAKYPLIAVQFLVMQHNEHELPTVRKLAKELGVDRLLIKNIEVHSVQEAREWLPQNDKFRRYDFDGEHLRVKNNNKKSCPRPWLSTLINWDGGLVPCCFDKNGTFEMGNIHQVQNFDQLWFNEKFQAFRHRLNTNRKSIDMCRNCNQGFGSFIPEFKLFGTKDAVSQQK